MKPNPQCDDHHCQRQQKIYQVKMELMLSSVKVQCESKKVVPPQKKLFCNVFTQAKYIADIAMKFCQFVASIYPHILTSFGQFILIFNNFSRSTYCFSISSFEFYQVRLP